MAGGSRRRAASAAKEACDFCGGWFDPAGLPRHVLSCRKEHEDQERDSLALAQIARREAKRKGKRRKLANTTDAAEDQLDMPGPGPAPEEQAPSPPPVTVADLDPDEDLPLVQVLPSSWLAPQVPTPIAAEEDSEAPPAPPPTTPADSSPADSVPASPRAPEKDDIRVEYHPASGRGTKISAFKDYQREYPARPPTEGDDKAFAPFNTLEDYEFAEIALDAGLKKPQVDRLLGLIQAGKTGTSKVTFQTSADVDAAWDKAALYHPPFVKHTFEVDYLGEPQEYQVYVRDMWSWIETVIKEPSLSSKWQWDAQKMSKWDEDQNEWMPYWEDPSTADKMWEVQTTLQDDGHLDGKPLGIILFADKSKISSFGTQQGYPVVARIANLSDDVRNGTGFGGGRVVGFLPLVKDHPKHHKKTSWVDHKNEVWHTAMSLVLKGIEMKSKTGVSIVCGDKKIRKLFPFIHILSADYEEQCVMALIRGTQGKCPCPICLVPDDELSDLRGEWPDRTTEESQRLVNGQYKNKAHKEDVLKAHGLRAVPNVFWRIANTCIHRALSLDRLHSYHIGIFGKHLWVLFKKIANHKGFQRAWQAMIDDGAMAMPRWRNLHHFSGGVLLVDFTDGTKYQDLSKILVFAACNAMDVKHSPAGYMLLGLIRKYIECDMYLGLEVHTEATLQQLDQAIVNFGDALESFRDFYENLRPDNEKAKSWDFPKIHSHKHGVPDIKMKGVIQHMSTRLAEKVHGPIRKWVKTRSNNREIYDQITKIDHLFLCSGAIRHRLDDWAAILKEFEDSKMFVTPSTRALFQFESRYLGAREKPVSCNSLEARPDEAFKNFHARLLRTLKAIYAGRGSAVIPSVKADGSSIIECRLVEVDYESEVTWRTVKDLLRCSPSFYDEPRYDSIMFHDFEGTTALAQLVFPFVVQLDSGEREPMLLIQPTTQATRRDMDHHLGLYPYLMKTRDKCRIIPLISLIRGAVLFKDASRTSHYFAVDTLDSDMFIRMKSAFTKQ